MKKFLTALTAAACAAAISFALPACGAADEDVTKVSVYMPDGAPALAMAQLMVDEPDLGADVEYNVVAASAIATYVSGGTADVCILPVNAAVQVASNGENYSMLGVVTHGNLYMLSADEQEVTRDGLDELVGKTVGCIQLSSFVGAVFKIILEEENIPYTVVEDISAASPEAVNLINIANPAQEISPAAGFDYMIAAEPVVTAKTSTGALKVVGDLQELYGEEGYPQAVMVAKNSLISQSPEFITSLISAMNGNAEWILSDDASVADIVAAINSNGGANSLTENNLKPATIERCAISFDPAAQSRQSVIDFIEKYNAATKSSLSVADKFFYGYAA